MFQLISILLILNADVTAAAYDYVCMISSS